jgi:hypothetical protein
MNAKTLHHLLTSKILSHSFTDDFFIQVLVFEIYLPAYPETPPQDNPSSRDLIVQFCNSDSSFSGQILVQHPDRNQLSFIQKVIVSELKELELDYIDNDHMLDLFVCASAATLFVQIPSYLEHLGIETEYALVATTQTNKMIFHSPHQHKILPGEHAQITLHKISVKGSVFVIHLINIPARSPDVIALMKILSSVNPYCRDFYYQPQPHNLP